MTIDHAALMRELAERRQTAIRRYSEDPLPATEEEARARLRREIDEHRLATHIVDLELDGYTILPPGKAASLEFTDRLRNAILRSRDERDARNLERRVPLSLGFGYTAHHLLPVDPVFQEAVMNPAVLTLVTYLAGYRAKLSTTVGLIKSSESDAALYWHSDNSHRLPPPHPTVSTGANVNWLLTDYSRENGALCVVPGSHTWGRGPDAGFAYDDPRVKVVEVPAGSIAVWHCNLWHAALPRTAAGERVSFVTLFLRAWMQPQEISTFTTTDEMIERNPPRFSIVSGVLSDNVYGEEGPNLESRPTHPTTFGRWT